VRVQRSGQVVTLVVGGGAKGACSNVSQLPQKIRAGE